MLTVQKCTIKDLNKYKTQILDFRKRFFIQTYPDESLPDNSNWMKMAKKHYQQFPGFLYYNIFDDHQIIADVFLFKQPLQTGGTKAQIAINYDEKTDSEELFNIICKMVNEWKTQGDLAVIYARQHLANRTAQHCQFTKGNNSKWMKLEFVEMNHDLLNNWIKLLPENCQYKITADLSDKEREEVAEAVNFFFQDMKRDDTVVSTHLTADFILKMEEMEKVRQASCKYLIIRDMNSKLIALSYVAHKISEPAYARQMMTGVVPDYRRKGLGKFMKAAMYRYLIQEAPHIKGVRTSCITENYRIIGLNEQIGFKPHYDEQEWYYQN